MWTDICQWNRSSIYNMLVKQHKSSFSFIDGGGVSEIKSCKKKKKVKKSETSYSDCALWISNHSPSIFEGHPSSWVALFPRCEKVVSSTVMTEESYFPPLSLCQQRLNVAYWQSREGRRPLVRWVNLRAALTFICVGLKPNWHIMG